MQKITMNVKELCELLGISPTTAYSLVREDKIPYFRIRGKILFNQNVIEDWTRQESIKQEVTS